MINWGTKLETEDGGEAEGTEISTDKPDFIYCDMTIYDEYNI